MYNSDAFRFCKGKECKNEKEKKNYDSSPNNWIFDKHLIRKFKIAIKLIMLLS